MTRAQAVIWILDRLFDARASNNDAAHALHALGVKADEIDAARAVIKEISGRTA